MMQRANFRQSVAHQEYLHQTIAFHLLSKTCKTLKSAQNCIQYTIGQAEFPMTMHALSYLGYCPGQSKS
jgi:hypothetical protein